MPDSTHVVSLAPSGRVQIYDAHWKFVRGWAIGSYPSEFKVVPTGTDQFDVYLYRSLKRPTYRVNGDLVARGTREPGDYERAPNLGMRYRFWPWPWLLVFASPMFAWLVTMVGVVLLFVLKGIERRAQAPPRAP